MEERIQPRPSRPLPEQESLPAGPPPPPEAPSLDALLDTQVTVISGPHLQSFPLANQTVSRVRSLLQGPFNIGPQAMVLVNGQPVSPEHVLRPGDALEFVHHAGEKGRGTDT